MLSGIILVLIAGLSWVVCGAVMGRGPKDGIPSDVLVFGIFLVASAASIGIGFTQTVPELSPMNIVLLLLLLASGVFNGFQLYFMGEAMQKGPNGLIWMVIQSAFIVPFLVGTFFYDSQSSWFRWCGFFLVLIALVGIGLTKNEKHSRYGNWKMPAFWGFVATGILNVFNNIPSYYADADAISSVWRAAAAYSGLVIGAVVIPLVQRKFRGFLTNVRRCFALRRMWCYALVMNAVQLSVAFFCLYPGMDRLAQADAGAIAYPLMMGACLIGFELYSRLVLREKRTWVQTLCLVCCFAGVIVLAL